MPYCDPINVPFVVSELQRLNPRSRRPHGSGPRRQKRYDDVGLRLLMRAAVRRVFLKLSSSAPVNGILLQ